MLDGMLFRGPLSFKLNRDLQQWIRLSVVIRMNSGMYCGFFIHVLMCTAYTNLANTFLIAFYRKTAICRQCLRLRASK